MSNYFREPWKNTYQTLFLSNQSHIRYRFVIWFIILFFSRIFSVYIPSLSLSISSSSLFFFMLGFLSPNIYSLFLASFVDLFYLMKFNFSFNIFFFLQPIVLTVSGWLIRFLFQNQNIKLTKQLLAALNIFGIFLSIFFDYHVFYYVLFTSIMYLMFNKNSENTIFILLALSISAYLVSFCLGVNGAFLFVNSDLTSLLFKSRVIKEIMKNFAFFFIIDLFLRKYEFK